jgi:hypothetical protein
MKSIFTQWRPRIAVGKDFISALDKKPIDIEKRIARAVAHYRGFLTAFPGCHSRPESQMQSGGFGILTALK